MSEELKNYLGNINYEIEISDIELEKLDLGLNAKSWKELLDYINNLQEENEHLDKANCHLRKKINNDIYKQRNEKARAKLQSMFDNGNEETILDDLLELDRVLGDDKSE